MNNEPDGWEASMKKISRIILISAIVVIILSTIVLSLIRASGSRKFSDDTKTSGVEILENEIFQIKIYVTGEVVSPGIIEIKKGSTILDAVEACGGFTELASSNINLVYTLEKNVTLIIKGKEDGGGVRVLEKPGDALLIDDENGIIDGKININHADAEALGLLPGVGEKTALDIIAFRDKYGPFNKIEDIMGVPGIKESKFNKIKEYICIE